MVSSAIGLSAQSPSSGIYNDILASNLYAMIVSAVEALPSSLWQSSAKQKIKRPKEGDWAKKYICLLHPKHEALHLLSVIRMFLFQDLGDAGDESVARTTPRNSYREFAGQLLQPEWLIDIPADFYKDWYANAF